MGVGFRIKGLHGWGLRSVNKCPLLNSGVHLPADKGLVTSELETPTSGKSSVKKACKQFPTPDRARNKLLKEPVFNDEESMKNRQDVAHIYF